MTPTRDVTLRGLRVGDLGMVAARQAILYAADYGFNQDYEALVATILVEFHNRFEASRDQAWIAERNGQMAGSVFLVRGDQPGVARLRLLYVEPSARGAGVGRLLVERCIEHARALGYAQLTLWTQSILVAAGALYRRAGFRLIHEEAHVSFGQSLTGQTWLLDL